MDKLYKIAFFGLFFFFIPRANSFFQDSSSDILSDILIDIISQYKSLKDLNFAIGSLKATNKTFLAILSSNINSKYVLKLASDLFANKRLSHLFYLATTNGYINIVRLFFSIGLSDDTHDDLDSLLSEISRNKNIKVVKLLLDHGANINFQNQLVLTPLMEASCSNNSEMVKFLIKEGADIDLQDSYGNTAISHAVKRFNIKSAFVLYKHGANLNIKNSGNNSARDIMIGHALDTGVVSCFLFSGIIIILFYFITVDYDILSENFYIRTRFV